MKNLKKLLAVLVVVTMLATSMIPVFAAGSYSYSTQAQALYDLGLYKGSSSASFNPDLGSSLDRQMGVVLLIRLLGKESAALALTNAEVDATLIIFSDAKNLASWAKKQIAYAVLYKLVAGLPNGTFAPNNALSGKEFATMLIRSLGYTVDAAGYAGACYQLQLLGGLTFSEAAKFNEKELTRDDAVGIMYGFLKVDYKATKQSVIETLVTNAVVTEAKAIASGAYNTHLAEDARAAIDAYKAAPIATLTQIAAAEAKKAAADAAVAKIIDTTAKTAFQKEIDAQAAIIAAAKKALQDADAAEAAAIAAAETAVKAYESAALATSADVTAAKDLGTAATAKVNLVKTTASKDAFNARIAAQDKVVAAREADLAAIATASAKVDEYVAAAYDTLTNVAAAEALEAAAEALVAKIVDTTAKADLTAKIDAQSKLVAAKKADLTPAVVTVAANSLTIATLTFNKAMDATTIVTANVKVDGVGVATANMTLSADKKVLTIAYAAAKQQNDSVKVTLSGLKDVNGVAMASFDQTYTVKDITDPAVASVAVVNYKQLKVYTSEPLVVNTGAVYKTTDYTNSAITIKIDGNLTFAKLTTLADEGYILVDLFNSLAAGAHTITVADAKDQAGFKIADFSGSFNVDADTTAPVATAVEYVAKNQVKVTFSENIADGAAAYGAPTFSFNEEGVAAAAVAGAVYNNNTVTLTTAANMTIAATVGYTVTYTNAQDMIGNKTTTAQTIKGQAPDDTAKPQVSSYSVIAGNKIKVVFNEAVNAATGNFNLYQADGTTLVKAGADDVTFNTAQTEATVTFNAIATVNVTNYQIKIFDVTDKSIRVNKMDAIQPTISTIDTAKPTITAAVTTAFASGKQTVELIFSEAMNSTLLAATSSYYVGRADNVISDQLSNIASAAVTVNSSNKVTLTIPNTGAAYTEIAVPTMKDTTGNLLNGLGNALTATMNIAADYSGIAVLAGDLDVTATGTTTIKVAINQTDKPGYTFTTADANAFKFVVVGGAVYDQDFGVIAAQITDNGQSITLTTSRALNYNASYDNAGNAYPVGNYGVQLYINGATVKDQNSQAVTVAKAAAIAVVDKIAGVQNAPVGDAAADNNAVITIPFSENIQCTVAGALDSQLTLKVGTTTLIPGVDYTSVIAGSNIVVTITTVGGAAWNNGDTKTVNVQVNTTYIKDTSAAMNATTAAAAANVSVKK